MAASEGVDLEWCIVETINQKNGNIVKFSRNYSDTIKKQAQQCVNHLYKFAGNKPVEAWHSDDPKNPSGGPIYAKPEPKTDVVFKIGNKTYFTSVKMAGPVQLASGQGKSTAELFQAAANNLPNSTDRKVISSIIKELEVMPTRMLSFSNFDRIMKEANSKTIDEFIKSGKIIQSKDYEIWLENNKPALMGALLDYAEKDLDFYAALIEEALTGNETLKQFRGAVADSIISPKEFAEIDLGYVYDIIPKIKLDIRGKSRGGITGLAFRIDYRP